MFLAILIILIVSQKFSFCQTQSKRILCKSACLVFAQVFFYKENINSMLETCEISQMNALDTDTDNEKHNCQKSIFYLFWDSNT